MREGDLFKVSTKGCDVDCVPHVFGPGVSTLKIRFHITPVYVVSDICVDVAIKSGFEDHYRDRSGVQMLRLCKGLRSPHAVEVGGQFIGVNVQFSIGTKLLVRR